ncbi:MAG: lipid-A-disaccharide synthase [Albidovulum sp.]|nr:lipid-A-disaccharide synthase [Albidovulum sp.]
MTRLRLFLVAGEPSGDRLGAALMAGFRSIGAECEFGGVGGPAMQAEGLQSIFPFSDLSVMGFAEVVPKLPRLLARLGETARAVGSFKPHALVTIDSPDFCLRVAAKAKNANPDLLAIQYVAPTVWAWRPWRASKLARIFDHVLAVYPFEPGFLRRYNVDSTFVGHPATEIHAPSQERVEDLKHELAIEEGEPVAAILPGSRKSEVARLGPVFGNALGLAVREIPGIRPIVPAALPVAELVEDVVEAWPVRATVLDPRHHGAELAETRKMSALASASAAIAASGTVSIELAAVATPMVIAYDMNWLTRQAIAALLNVESVCLVNLAAETKAIPECLGRNCRPDVIAREFVRLFQDPLIRDRQLRACEAALKRLGAGEDPPGERAARVIVNLIP